LHNTRLPTGGASTSTSAAAAEEEDEEGPPPPLEALEEEEGAFGLFRGEPAESEGAGEARRTAGEGALGGSLSPMDPDVFSPGRSLMEVVNLPPLLDLISSARGAATSSPACFSRKRWVR
jgi:hypothetical protein